MSSTERAAHRALAFIVAWPKSVLAVFVVCAAVLGWQARHFEIDASEETLLTPNNVNYIRTQVMNQRFAPEEFLLVAYEPRSWPVFSPRTFADLEELSRRLRKLERVQSVRSILDVPLLRLAERGASLELDPSALTIERQHFSLAQIRRAFAGDPIYEDLLVNASQTATAIQVVFRADPKLEKLHGRITELRQKSLENGLTDEEQAVLEQLQAQAEPLEERLRETRTAEIEAIRGIVADYEDDANIYLGGGHVLAYQLIQIIRADLIVFGTAIAVMIAVLLLALFRRIKWVFIPLLACAVSVLATMGLFGWLGFKVTVISANFIALQLILTLSLVVHLIVQYREYAAARPAWEQDELVRQTLYRKAGPILYAGLTTSIGFGSLLFSDIQPVITFGWMMIIAMFVSIAVSLILFPSLMAMFAPERAPGSRPSRAGCWTSSRGFRSGSARRSGSSLRRSGRQRRRDCCGSTSRTASSTTSANPPTCAARSPSSTASSAAPRRSISSTTSRRRWKKGPRAVGEDGAGAAAHPEGAGAAGGRGQGAVGGELHRGREGDQQRPAAHRIRADRDLLAARRVGARKPRRLVHLARARTGADQCPGAGHDRGLDRAQLLADIRAAMDRLQVPPEHYTLTNLFVLYQDLLQRLFRSQILTLGIVYAVLALAFVAIFRSVRIALIALAPNVLATLAVLGFMGWFRIPLDFMTITIASIAMGIAVDDTIHYIHRYLEELRDGASERAVQRSHGTVGHAVLYTSLIIVLGFSLLAFSDFVPSVLFGLLTALAMTLALVFALTVLPALLSRFVRSA